ncbi:MAG: hypothetical protein RMK20_12970, partial [Verrucomicrobiales bacterium]|nr:hypothetical protein [Verrucomicrobiales bacterium]
MKRNTIIRRGFGRVCGGVFWSGDPSVQGSCCSRTASWRRPVFGPAHLLLLPLMVWSLIAGRLGAADVTLFGMGKGQQFAQSVGSAPVLLASNAFTFQALVLASTNGVVTNATFKISTSPTVERQLTNTGSGTLWRYEDFANTQSQLDATYPTGNTFSRPTYTFTMHTVNDGIRAVAL